MASPSEVKAGLDAISRSIASNRQRLKQAKQGVAEATAALQALPSTYTDVITTVQGYSPATTVLTEQVAASELGELTAEFMQLRAKGQAAKDALNDLGFEHE